MFKVFRFFLRLIILIVIINLSFWLLNVITQKVYRRNIPKSFNSFTFNKDQYSDVSYHNYDKFGGETVFIYQKRLDDMLAIYTIKSSKDPLEKRKNPHHEYYQHRINNTDGYKSTYEEIWDGHSGTVSEFIYSVGDTSYQVTYEDYSQTLFVPPAIWYSLDDLVNRIEYK